MKRKRMAAIAAGVLLLLASAWRVRSHSLDEILPAEGRRADAVFVRVTEFGAPDSPQMDSYTLEGASPEDALYASVLSIIGGTGYRADFRNLLPWDVLTVRSRENIAYSAAVMLAWGEADEEACHLLFQDERTVTVSVGGNRGFLIYHPTDRTTLTALSSYVKEHGQQEP